MKFLITGSEGFIGSWLKKVLPNTINLNSKNGDVTNYSLIKRILLKEEPTHIIHLAAISNPSVCNKKPKLAWKINVKGTENVLKVSELINTKVIVFSSALVYKDGINLKESSKLKTDGNMYIKTKLEVEELGKDYKAVIIRPFNQEGPGRQLDFFTSKVILSGLKNSELELWNPNSIREFMDIRDGVNGIKLIAIKGLRGEVYNLSSGKGLKKIDYLKLVEKILNKKINYKITNNDKTILAGNNSKLLKLGWRQRFNVNQTIKDQVRYIKKIYF